MPKKRKRKRISTTRNEVGIALALGGNLALPAGGHVRRRQRLIESVLRQAIEQLEANLGALRVAGLYRGPAVSPIPQPDFLNTAVVGRTALDPEAVLGIAKAIELAAGRRQGPRNSPRPLDIDLLLYGDICSTAPELTLPHPRLAQRRFVLAPLDEIAPDLSVPCIGATAGELLRRLSPTAPPVERLPWADAGTPAVRGL
jgi:2-amino-4-hydroxy-6-hydroxymethyldihydropteridine diphosphokinase